MNKKCHVECRKIFPDGTIMVYDYNINHAIKNIQDLVCHYKGVIKEYTMTIPYNEILKRGIHLKQVYKSRFSDSTYTCFHFKWVEDKE